jgi:L-lactate permease
MKMNKLLTMPIGLILLAIAIMMDKFLPSNSSLDFIEGFLMGLSVILNIVYIIATIQKTKTK